MFHVSTHPGPSSQSLTTWMSAGDPALRLLVGSDNDIAPHGQGAACRGRWRRVGERWSFPCHFLRVLVSVTHDDSVFLLSVCGHCRLASAPWPVHSGSRLAERRGGGAGRQRALLKEHVSFWNVWLWASCTFLRWGDHSGSSFIFMMSDILLT